MKPFKKFTNKLSIKQKWTFVSAFTIIVSYALISSIVYIAIHNWLINDEESSAIRTAEDVQTFFRTEGAFITIKDIQNNTSLINAIVDQAQTVRIYNFDHIEIIRINNTMPAPQKKPNVEYILSSTIIKDKIGDSNSYIVYKPIQIGSFTGYMELIHPLDKFHSMMTYILTLLLLLGIGAVVIASILSRSIATLLLKPILQLRDSMSKVRDSGLSVQSNVHYEAQDEIGDLFRMYHSMLNELKESFDRQQQFVQDASHELRTPIQAIEGHLSLIDRWGKDDPSILNESIQTSLTEVRRMKKLMEELLLLARNEARSANATVEVENVIQQVIEELNFIYPSATFRIFADDVIKHAKISEQALSQIVRNIFENGIHYNEQQPIIEIYITSVGSIVQITIKDNGIGIAEEHIPFIFNRFYRADESRHNEHGRTGLGLSITKMLADKYDIKIKVKSKVNEGTSFTLEIPS
jgi:two-component system, OmpR family, sensor histidine kinase ArlS